MLRSKIQGLFIGAGFSYDFGMPLVSGLTKELKNYLTPKELQILNQSWRIQGGGICNEILLKVTHLLESNINYEEIIGALEVEENRHENHSIRNNLHYIRNKLLDLIFVLLHQRHVKNSLFIKTSIEMHRGFKSLVSTHHPLWIFSLNHDLIIEILCAEFSIPLKNGFSDETISLSFDTYGKIMAKFKMLDMSGELTYPYNYFRSNESGINLLKIHGSLDIFGYDDLRRYLCVIPEKNTLHDYLYTLNQLLEIHPTGLPTMINELVMFDKNKETQFLRKSLLSGVYKFKNQQTQIISLKILDLFKSSLNYIDELIIIGYGFGDIHINLILKKWLESTSRRSIIIINPYTNEIPNFMRHLSIQITTRRTHSAEYFSSLPNGRFTDYELFIRNLREARTD